MSSILKALKKLEEEKSLLDERKEINVSREILKQPTDNRKLVKWFWLLGSAATLVIIMLTLALMRTPATKAAVKLHELPGALPPVVTRAPAPDLPVIPPRLSGNDGGAGRGGRAPVTAPEQHPVRQPALSSGESLQQMKPAELPVNTAPVAVPQKTDPAVKSVPLPAAVTSEQSLALSGIAWNKDSADRLAIINGQPTAIGATVSGMVVEEILQDRVKLSHDGRTIELMLGKNSKTE